MIKVFDGPGPRAIDHVRFRAAERGEVTGRSSLFDVISPKRPSASSAIGKLTSHGFQFIGSAGAKLLE